MGPKEEDIKFGTLRLEIERSVRFAKIIIKKGEKGYMTHIIIYLLNYTV